MPKARTRRKRKAQTNVAAGLAPAVAGSRQEMNAPARPVTTARRPSSLFGGSGRQGIVMSALVALGCWGMAISFAFFSADPNHYLYAGMAAVMGLMWSFSFGLRISKNRDR